MEWEIVLPNEEERDRRAGFDTTRKEQDKCSEKPFASQTPTSGSQDKLYLSVLPLTLFHDDQEAGCGGGEGGFLEKIHSCDNSSSSRPRYNTQSVLLLAIPLGNERDKSESISRLNLCERYSLYSLFFFRIIYIYIRKKNLLLGRKLQSSHPPTVFSFIVKNPSFF